MSTDNYDNFKTARSMIPMEQVKQIVEDRKCRNHTKGCKFQTKWFYCTACMMHFAIGCDFFDTLKRLTIEDPDYAFSMTQWQRDNFDDDYVYNTKWLDNFPRGASP